MSVPAWLDTKIEGDPASIYVLGNTLARVAGGFEDLVGTLSGIRADSSDLWDGGAAEAFRGRLTLLRGRAELAGTAIGKAASAADAYAELLGTAQREVSTALGAAVEAGVRVFETWAWRPDPGPGEFTSRDEIDDFLEAMRAYTHLSETVQEYAGACVTAARQLDQVIEELTEVGEALVTDALANGVKGLMKGNSSASKVGRHFSTKILDAIETSRLLAHLDLSDGAILNRLGQAKHNLRNGVQMATVGADRPRWAKIGGRYIDTALLVYGIESDLADGESLKQAVISQGVATVAGAAGSAAAGAAVLTFWTGPLTPLIAGGAGLVGGTVAAVTADNLVDEGFEGEPYGPPDPPEGHPAHQSYTEPSW